MIIEDESSYARVSDLIKGPIVRALVDSVDLSLSLVGSDLNYHYVSRIILHLY